MDGGQLELAINWITHNIVQIALILSIFIQITPIKWNPWTTLFKWIGRLITGDLDKKITTLSKSVYENEKDRIRWEVLSFANSCRNGCKHTRDEYLHIITLHDKYINLLKITNDNNGVFDEEYKYILTEYKNNDFL